MLDFPDGIDEYATAHTTTPDSVFDDIAVDVESTGVAGMMSGRTVGYFLNTLVTISDAKRVLEVGTFVGYSALMMASALPEDGEVITCDVSEEFTSIARKHWARHPAGKKDRPPLGASDRDLGHPLAPVRSGLHRRRQSELRGLLREGARTIGAPRRDRR